MLIPSAVNEVIIARKAFFSASAIYREPGASLKQSQKLYGSLSLSDYGVGHNYTLEAYFQGKVDVKSGLVVNLTDVDRLLKKVIAQMDHQNLSITIPAFKTVVPTPERLAQYIKNEILESMPLYWQDRDLVRLAKVRLYQGDDFWVDV